jgi:hypothetical protein
LTSWVESTLDRARALEYHIRNEAHVRAAYHGDNGHDARTERAEARDSVANSRLRTTRACRNLRSYVRGAARGVDAIAQISRSPEHLAVLAIEAPLRKISKPCQCASCGWRRAQHGHRLCSGCAGSFGQTLGRMFRGFAPTVAARLVPVLRGTPVDPFTLPDDPGCGCGGPECSQCGTPQDDPVDALAFHEAELSADERDAFTL